MTNDCCSDCCAGTAVLTPVEVVNPPSRNEITHRVGTHAEFLASMRARLSSPAYPALAALTVRGTEDPAIGLLDAGAVLGDLLTFYTERIANEGYLRTATEQRSLTLLGRLVGHTPRPGVAAGAFLAYTLDADPRQGRDFQVRIPRGARTQSVPGPGEEPQSFETIEDLLARWSWNDLRVRQTRPYQFTMDDLGKRTAVHVAGVSANLKPGDQLLFVFGAEPGRQQHTVVPGVTLDRDRDVTTIGLPQPALPTLAELNKDLLAELKKLVDPDPADPEQPPEVVRRSAILRRLVEGPVTELWRIRHTLTTPTRFAKEVSALRERVAETTALAEHYVHIATWLKSFDQTLGALETTARKLEPKQDWEPAPERLYHALALDAEVPGRSEAVLGLGALLGALRTSTTRPPAGSRYLARELARIYAPGSDLGAQLLSALDDRLRDSLYPAWRQTDLSTPLALQELHAMRVVATPFGATAPPELRVSGGVATPQEWSLRSLQTLRLRVDYDAEVHTTRVVLHFIAGNGAWEHILTDLTEEVTVDLGPGQFTFTPATGKISFAFSKELPERKVEVFEQNAEKKIKVRLTGEALPVLEHTLAVGDEPWWQEHGEGFLARFQRIAATAGPPKTVEHVDFTIQTYALTPSRILALDGVYEGIGPGSWVVITRPRKGREIGGDEKLSTVTARVTTARTIAKQAFGISAKVTELTLDRPWLDKQDTLLSHLRDATVYARGDRLELAEEPVPEPVAGNVIELAELYDGLTPGRWVIVTGERADLPGGTTGVRGTELAMIAGVTQKVDPERPGEKVHTEITLAAPLAHRYLRISVRVHGNVVRATHGASRDEPIGSGDASKPGQSFLLRQGPLTWLAADNPVGAHSTLEIRVDGVRWQEVDSLAGRGPTERVYVTALTDTGALKITFGDGRHGARLPTGVENVRASYRVGLGKSGNVTAGQLTQLTTRPLGVSAVTNPLPADGGANRDDAGQLRRNIPLRVTALDRLVSVPDYADFARARAGIGRAEARQLHNGSRQVVHVTVAGTDDIPLHPDSDLITTLRAAFTAHGDAGLPAEVAVREPVLLVIAANIRVHPDHSWDLVEPAVRAALLGRLGFAGRELGQPAYLSEVLATAQAMPGVDHVDVDSFAGVPGSITPLGLQQLATDLARPNPVVPARLAQYTVDRYTVAPASGPTETLTAVAAKHGISVAELVRLNPDITDARPLDRGRVVVVFRGVRPAQFVLLSPTLPDTLILKEVR
ncbi:MULTISPECIES: putative baseplate assembly protein [unclassified Crossiella]|uniref:putative baseplate assembly protein n=1 Tax=unclassified Crossiella TaxID=2620835 RepID=UPI001FFE4020|nr:MULTISPECIES: putative baseplate assembly protein [unclassified Crossiella]MCK2242414.1 putative baseplate assembly protein [Crossiella sp. S99.2]MCK2254555.1 putative baseplate assembly protein [Crossiella sp. S99.1]